MPHRRRERRSGKGVDSRNRRLPFRVRRSNPRGGKKENIKSFLPGNAKGEIASSRPPIGPVREAGRQRETTLTSEPAANPPFRRGMRDCSTTYSEVNKALLIVAGVPLPPPPISATPLRNARGRGATWILTPGPQRAGNAADAAGVHGTCAVRRRKTSARPCLVCTKLQATRCNDRGSSLFLSFSFSFALLFHFFRFVRRGLGWQTPSTSTVCLLSISFSLLVRLIHLPI